MDKADLREAFIAHALTGLLSDARRAFQPHEFARMAVEQADAVMKLLKGEEDNEDIINWPNNSETSSKG